MLDPVEFGKAMAAIVRETVEPLQKRIDDLEAREPERGAKGQDGKDAEPVDIGAVVDAAVAKLLKSERIATLADLSAAEAVAKHFEAHPVEPGKPGDPGKKGDPGENGKSVTVEEVAVFMDAAISKHVLELDRRATDAINRAIDKIPAPKDGKDGADFTNVSFDYDGERTLAIRGTGGDIVKRLPIPIDRGYYRDGMKSEKGDILTQDGNAWIALADTDSKPCHENKDAWRMLARKGRDGRDGIDAKPPAGPVKLGSDD